LGIEFKGVYYRYPETDVDVLRGIWLEIGEGEAVAILGDNGAGKTTLIKHMNGLLKPSKGDVYVDGVNTREVEVSTLARKVALVFQYPEKMFFSETVYDEVSFALKNFGFEKDLIPRIVEKTLKMFWLWEYRDRSPYTLSGGEQRRLALASILSWDPKYIVLDEPTAGQDAIQREILTHLINRKIREGKTVILVSHDVEFIAEFSPRTILLKDGEIIFDGEADDLFRRKDLLVEAGLEQPTLYQLSDRLGLAKTDERITLELLIEYIGRMMQCTE